MTPLALEENEVLFGADPLEGIVAVERSGDRSMRLFLRHGKKLVTPREDPFVSFILVEDETLMKGFKSPYKAEPLSGANEYKVLVLFEGWDLCQKARDHLQKRTECGSSSHPGQEPQRRHRFHPFGQGVR